MAHKYIYLLIISANVSKIENFTPQQHAKDWVTHARCFFPWHLQYCSKRHGRIYMYEMLSNNNNDKNLFSLFWSISIFAKFVNLNYLLILKSLLLFRHLMTLLDDEKRFTVKMKISYLNVFWHLFYWIDMCYFCYWIDAEILIKRAINSAWIHFNKENVQFIYEWNKGQIIMWL